MSKIAAISCIILAVSINFEGIQANLLGKPLGSLLNNVQKQWPGGFQNPITNGIKSLQNIGNDASDLVTERNELNNENEGFVKQASILTCVKLYNEGRTIFTKLTSILKSCLSSEIQAVDTEIQVVVKLISDLQKNITEKIQEILAQHSGNIVTAFPDLFKKFQELFGGKLGSAIEDVLSKILHLLSTLSNVGTCFETSYVKDVQPAVRTFINDARECYQSIPRLIKY
nr:PREDICTED: uncharacterized protein LOC105676041 [Linepithema humile]